jgi:hypothetical protein
MNALKTLEKRIRGWVPKEHRIVFAQKVAKPWWWNPLWISAIVANILWLLFGFSVLHLSVDRLVTVAVVTAVALGFAYYIRVKPSIAINRAVYVLIGVTPIGFALGILWELTVGSLLNGYVGAYPALLISLAIWLPIGGFIGDWIGKKRNYILPLSI